MTPIKTRQDLSDYCLRQLGGGVVNIEISDEQIDDNINNAIQYYQEFHFDGIERDYVVHKITATTFTVADSTGWAVKDVVKLTTDNSIYATISAIDGNTITISRIEGGGVFAINSSLTNGTTIKSVVTITLGDVDTRYIEVDDSVVGVIKVLNINKLINTTDYMFDIKYQIMMQEIKNLTSGGGSSYVYGMMQYLGHLEFILNKEKDFRFNRRMNKIFLDVNWGADINIGDVVTVEVYKALDEETYGEILNDIWLKRYCTALFKRQWGTNIKKYQGMQLPGGVTYDGQQIFEEALADIKDLEQQAIEQSAPLSFMVG